MVSSLPKASQDQTYVWKRELQWKLQSVSNYKAKSGENWKCFYKGSVRRLMYALTGRDISASFERQACNQGKEKHGENI